MSSPRHYHISPPLSSSFMCLPHLQQSLRDTLSDYHVLAGRLTVNAYSQQAIRLTDDGVGWTTARTELRLDEILPSPLQRLDAYDSGALPAGLMTSLPATCSSSSPLLQLQYTALGCGSVCLAVSVYHGVMDAKALFLFMNCWSQQSRGKRYTRPSHERHVLTNMRAAATTCITHDEYMVVARMPKPTQPPTPVLPSAGAGGGQAAMLPRSLSAGVGNQLSLAGSVSRSSSRAEMAMRTFHFSRLEIERMKRSVLECQSPSFSSSPSVLFSPPQTPTAFSLPPALVSPSHSAAAAGSRTIFSPLSPPLSGPTSPRLSSTTLHNPPYHPDYVSTFDVLAAHVWQLVMRARFPQLVSTLPPPPPPPPSSLSLYEIGTAALSPTQSRPSTPVRAFSGSFSSSFSSSTPSVPSPSQSAQSRQPAMPSSASFTQPSSGVLSPPSASSFVTLLPPAAASAVVTHLAIAFNGRNRLEPPLPDVFCGNVTFFAIVPSPLPALLTAPLHVLTRAIRSRMNGMVGEYLRSALTILSSPPPPHSRLVPSFDTKGPDVLMTSWLTCEVYAADFGYGRPDWVGVAGGEDRARWEGYVCMIRAGREEPAAAAAGAAADGSAGPGRGGGIEVIPPGDASRAEGVDVVVCLKEEEMRRLVADERLRCWRPEAQRRSEAAAGGRQVLGMLLEAMEHLELQSTDAPETRMQQELAGAATLPYRTL